jgi:Zn-dependent M28 family amino/carboxypeptidase
MKLKAKTVAALGALACAASALSGCALWHETVGLRGPVRMQQPRAVAAPADMPSFRAAPMTPPALRGHVERLASDAFEGRAPATQGEALTIDYIVRAFTAAGLQPGARQPDGSIGWRQTVPLSVSRLSNAPDIDLTQGRERNTLRYGADIVLWTKRDAPSVSLADAELVFVGYGVVSPQLGWNDYAGLDMHGRVALILANDPDFATGDDRGFGGRALSAFGDVSTKLEEAARQGAEGALIIHETGAVGVTWDRIGATYSGAQFDLVRDDAGAGRPAVEGWIRQGAAEALIARAGFDLATLRAQAQRPDFTPTPLEVSASTSLEVEHETRMSANVIGVLPGGRRENEAVLYAANWDDLGHCPPVAGDDICNGALDNASGVAGLIELARRFSSEQRRQRSLAFVAFTGREAGRLGSQFYAAHPAFAPEHTAAAIQLNSLSINGPTRDIVVAGYGQGDLERLLGEAAARQNRAVASELHPELSTFYGSDAFSLARAGIPTLAVVPGYNLYLGGEARGRALAQTYLTERAHTPDDEVTPSWDLTGATRDLLALHDLGARLADSDQWPNWRAGSEFRALRDAQRQR